MARQARARNHADDDKRSGPRPMWRGAVTFGLVTMPVALHPATSRERSSEAERAFLPLATVYLSKRHVYTSPSWRRVGWILCLPTDRRETRHSAAPSNTA